MPSLNIVPNEYQHVNHALCSPVGLRELYFLLSRAMGTYLWLPHPEVAKNLPKPFDNVGIPTILSPKEERPLVRHKFNILEDELPPEDQPYRELFTKIIGKGLHCDGTQMQKREDAPTVSETRFWYKLLGETNRFL